MLKIYLITIVLFYLSFALLFARYFVNKDEITSCKDEDKWFIYIRLFILSLIPIINLLVTILFIKVSIFHSNKEFINIVNK